MTQRIIPIHQAASHPTLPTRSTHQNHVVKPRTPPTARWESVPSAHPVTPAALQELSSTSATPRSHKLAVSIAEAAHLLSISRSHLYPIVMRGEIPSFHIGRSHLIRVSALEEWIRQQEEEAA